MYKLAKMFQTYFYSLVYLISWISLKLIGVKIGNNLRSFPITTIENPSGIEIGNNVWISKNVALYGLNGIIIGNDVTIAKDVSIISGDHGFSDKNKNINQQSMKKIDKPIKVDDDVWIGEKAIILKGVAIGKGCVIGAGSIVTKSTSPYTIVAGNPAKTIRRRK